MIRIITNGTLLLKQSDDFWDCCKINDVLIIVSVYPVDLDYAAIMDKAQSNGVRLQFWGNTKKHQKTGRYCQLILTVVRIKKKATHYGYASNYCFQLVDGKLYKCWRIAYINYFNMSFNTSLDVTEDDYIDIYKESDIGVILEKLRKPAPFCRYCKMDFDYPPILEWGKSKKEITEWI